MTAKLQTLFSRFLPDRQGDAEHVHFHQGPQGHPAPCFDERCPNPRL